MHVHWLKWFIATFAVGNKIYLHRNKFVALYYGFRVNIYFPVDGLVLLCINTIYVSSGRFDSRSVRVRRIRVIRYVQYGFVFL